MKNMRVCVCAKLVANCRLQMINSTIQYATLHTLIDTEFDKCVRHRSGLIIAKASV